MSPAQLASRILPSRSAPAAGNDVSADEIFNSRLLRFEAPFTNLAFSVGNFYTLFAIQLGASNSTIGWLTSGPALISLLWIIPCGQIIQRSNSYIRPMLTGAFLFRLAIMSMALIPLLPATWRAPGLVLLVTLGSVPSTLWGLAFHANTGELFTPRHRTRFIGQRWAVANVAAVVFMFGLGFLLDQIAFPTNFQVLFFCAPLVAMGTIVLLSRLRTAARPQPTQGSTRARFSLPILLQQARRYRRFVWFEAGVLLGYAAMFFAAPLFRIYWVRDLGAVGSWVGALTATYSIGAFLGNLFWGRLSAPQRDRRLTFLAAFGVMALYPFLTALCKSLWPLVAVTILAGFFAGGNELLIFNRVVHQSPRAHRAAFISAHNIVVNVAAFLTPLLSTALIDRIGAQAVLFIAAALGMTGAGGMYLLGWRGTLPEAEE